MGVILTGHIDVPENRRAEIKAALPEHIRLTRAEPGCEVFEVVADPDAPGRYHVSERFTDRAAFEAHQERAAASAWAQISGGIPRSCQTEET